MRSNGIQPQHYIQRRINSRYKEGSSEKRIGVAHITI